MAVISLVLSISALLFCVYLYLETQKKLSRTDIVYELSHASEELSKSFGKSVREIETEWTEMYQKFMRIAGRVDKVKALESPNPLPEEPKTLTRSDILRRSRRLHE